MRESNQTKIIGIRPASPILRKRLERLAQIDRRPFSQMGRILLEDAVTEKEKELGLPAIDSEESKGKESPDHAA